ncbi:MAG: hypothetical protein LBT79_08555 [Elusimicrobiota bacterium]|jgi:hypothetical protein|nr:hypothetical protein [Elusimicrobiota bacterium]
MEKQSNRAKLYKNMFLISTFFGIVGVFFLYKNVLVAVGWIGVSIWFILAVTVRILIIRDKKFQKDKKI